MRISFKKPTNKEYDIRYVKKFFWLPHYFDSCDKTFIWLESAHVVQRVLNGKWKTINLQEDEQIN